MDATAQYNAALQETVTRLYELEDSILPLLEQEKEIRAKYQIDVPKAAWLQQILSFGDNQNINAFKIEVEKYARALLRENDQILKVIDRDRARDLAATSKWVTPGHAVFQQQ